MKVKFLFKRLLILGIILFFVFNYVRQLMIINRIEQDIKDKQVQLQEIKQKNERLQDEVEKINSDSSDYLERLARERLGMIKPGEKVVGSQNETNTDEN